MMSPFTLNEILMEIRADEYQNILQIEWMQQKGIFYHKKGGKKFNRYNSPSSKFNAFGIGYTEVT